LLTFQVLLTDQADQDFADPVNGQPTFAHPGDSGSLVLDSNNNAVGTVTVAEDLTSDGYAAICSGPPISLILKNLDVTPILQDTVLSRKVTLTSSEAPATLPEPPFGGSNSNNSIWGKSTTGVQVHPPEIRRWTLTNVFQELTFQALVTGFHQPQFSWKLNGQPLNNQSPPQNFASTKTFNNITVSRYNSANPPESVATTESVTLTVSAPVQPQYNGSQTEASMTIFPQANATTVPGQIPITVEVTVSEVDASGGPISKTASAVLNTQQLTWQR